MAKQTINNLESAATVRSKLNSNFTELYDQKADKNHSYTDSSYGAASSELFGHVKIDVANGLNVSDGVVSLALATTTSAGAVQLADSLTSDDSGKALTAAQGKALKDSLTSLDDNTPPKNHAVNNSDYGLATDTLYGHLKVTSGNGLTLDNGTLSLNSATTSSAGAVQLEDSLSSSSITKALTANQGRILDEKKPDVFSGTTVPSNNIGRDGDLYILLGNN